MPIKGRSSEGRFALVLAFLSCGFREGESRPHIVFIVADDLGWNDVAWNNRDIIMPNLLELARNGVILNQSYVQPICTPSRVAFMTGYYPYHLGRQNSLISALIPTGLSLNVTLLPEALKTLGYKTHAIGKWHLGYCNVSYTPTYRGFDSFFGYYLGAEDYYNHSQIVEIPGTKTMEAGLDLRNGTSPAREYQGQYSTEIFKDAAVDIISNHPEDTPLFLYLPFQAVHSPIQVPLRYEKLYNFRNITRRKYCGMVTALDDAVGDIVKSLKARGLWENTTLIFINDNGGQIETGGNNWPLRGNKRTLWEGGTRAVSFIHHQNLLNASVCNNLFHAVDWYRTIISLAGGHSADPTDGVDQWPSILEDRPGPRQDFIYNIYDIPGERGAIRMKQYKLIVGDPGEPSGWFPPPECGESLNIGAENTTTEPVHLFNVLEDPEERHNLAKSYPVLTKSLLRRFRFLRSTMVRADDPEPDPAGRPSLWNNTFSPGWCQAK